MEPNQKNNFENNLEAEIALLSKEIEAKRRLLMEQKGVVEEKELVRDILREKIYPTLTTSSTTDDSQAAISQPVAEVKTVRTDHGRDYLENLDSETIVRVNELVSELSKGGLAAAISQAKKEPANVLDAFHDTLVNRLYDDLKQRGLIS